MPRSRRSRRHVEGGALVGLLDLRRLTSTADTNDPGDMRARAPDGTGVIERDGVRVGYEIFGSGEPTILFFTSWAIVHMRQWKAQVPYLARHFRVVTVEGRGNGNADRPDFPAAYADQEYVNDAVAVLEATGTSRAVAVGLSLGGRHALQLAAWHPERVTGVVAIGAALPWPLPSGFDDVRETYSGWEKANQNYWRADYRGWVEFFMSQVLTDSHSTKQWEDLVGWGLETDAETLLRTVPAVVEPNAADAEQVCRAIRCPVLIVHGEHDGIVPYEIGVALARWTGGSMVTIPRGGHAPTVRDPVRTNLLLHGFAASLAAPRPRRMEWTPARTRRRRALFVPSAIGLGHARRDVAVATELRALHHDLEVHWLAQHPVTEVLAEQHEWVHPASRWLASECAHIEAESGEHDLHAFQAIRRMDEIQVANFHVFHEIVDADPYDLVVADEGWEIDYFLHENPELKRCPFVWLTDFVGWLPMPDGGETEAAITADYNAEMIEHIARYPRLRDRSVFVGTADDLVTDPLGPGLPTVRDWTQAHYDFAGYISGTRPSMDRDAVRAEQGWRPDDQVCVVSAGGSGVGGHLLQRVAEAFPYALQRLPALKMVVVTGPRLQPESIPVPAGVEVRGYVQDLSRLMGACDVAVVHGGLTTTMELVEYGRPFLYFPLARHFEQQLHVPYRLRRYCAGTRMDYATSTGESIADAMTVALNKPTRSLPMETDGARRAAALIAELLQ